MKLNLGCGHVLLEGWTNIDGWSIKGAMKHDLAQGLPPIIKPGSVDFIFTEHFLEHITRDEALRLLKDCKRALRQGGVLRIIVPDLAHLVSKYVAKDIDWGGAGGWQPASPARMMNEGMRAWGHQFLYDAQELAAIGLEAGFELPPMPCAPRESSFAELRGIDNRNSPHDLRVEFYKA